MISDEADEVITIHLHENRYQNNLQFVRVSEFAFDYVQLLYYICYKINFNCESYIDFPKRLKNKKATINPIIKKDVS